MASRRRRRVIVTRTRSETAAEPQVTGDERAPLRRGEGELRAGGAALWKSVTDAHELDQVQSVQLLEACRAKDRLDQLDRVLSGDADTWARLVHRTRTADYELKIDDALAKANATANQMKQLLASLRLPDEAGKRPQKRGAARGSYASSAEKSGKVSSLDRARAAKSGA